jgi:hypothetical protein
MMGPVLEKHTCIHRISLVGEAWRVGHSNVFLCFASFKNRKTYQPAREKNKQEIITYIRTVIIKMSHINGKGIESTN